MIYVIITLSIAAILAWAAYSTNKSRCCSDGDEQWCDIECKK